MRQDPGRCPSPAGLRHLALTTCLISLTVVVSLCLEGRPPSTKSHAEYDPGLVWGAMIDLDQDYDWVRGIREDLGLKTARVSAHWDLCEPVRGKGYDWTATYRNIESALSWGLEPVVLITGTPRWASGITDADKEFLRERGLGHLGGVAQPAEEFIDEYARWLRALARRFKGRVMYYEYWNEPDGMGWPIIERDPSGNPTGVKWGGNPELYSKYLSATYEVIKSVDPEARVAVGGLESKTSFLRSLYEINGGSCFDAVCIHPYGGGEEMGHGPSGQALHYEWILEIRELMVEQGDGEKAIWVTEYGWRADPTDKAASATKVDYLQEALSYLSATSWITIAHVHYLSGDMDDPWDSSHPSLREAWQRVRWG